MTFIYVLPFHLKTFKYKTIETYYQIDVFFSNLPFPCDIIKKGPKIVSAFNIARRWDDF